MNLLQIRTEARRLIAETSVIASYSTDSDFTAYTNEGVKDMCVKGKVYERTKATSILTGIPTYSLPLDYLALRTILNPGGVSLDAMEPGGLGKVYVVSGKPLYYFISQTPLVLMVRQNDTIYATGAILLPTATNGYMYEVTVSGKTGSLPPTYPLVSGLSVTDNNATLICRELTASGYEVTFIDTPTSGGGGIGTYAIIYYALDAGLSLDTDAPNFPGDKHHLLVLFCCFRHFVKMKDLSRAMAFYTDYATALGIQPASTVAQGQGG